MDPPRRHRVAAVLLGTVLALGGCQAAEPTATPSEPLGQSPIPGATGLAVSTATPTPADDDVVSSAIAWIVGLAPGGPSGPDEVVAYSLLEEPTEENCSELLDSTLPEAVQTLYRGAAAACLAALHGRSNRWALAESAYDELADGPTGCLSRATFEVLQAAVEAHRQNPAATFRVSRSSAVEPPCPSIERVRAIRNSAGGLDIRVRGSRLGRVLAVGVRYVSECPAAMPDLGDFDRADYTRDGRSIRATVEADDLPTGATSVWVGLVAEPDPWVAAHDCVHIDGSEPNTSPPPSGGDAETSPSATL